MGFRWDGAVAVGVLAAWSALAAQTPDYTGAGSCSAEACHGSPEPRSTFRIQQNEYTTWGRKRDKHSKAFQVLRDGVSRTIARNLGLPEPADRTPLCLDCHALNVPEARRGRTFLISDGVSCEACHGPAEAWLGSHTTKGWTHAQSVQAGMTDTKDLFVRARTCLGCHVGDERRQVDHRLIAAGHPDLAFELDTFVAHQPMHWQPPKDPWAGARQWAVGQAVALAESMRLVSRRPASSWPEFADYECFACHHALVQTKDSWRVARGGGATPGRPTWNPSRWIVFRVLLRETDPDAAAAIEADLDALRKLFEDGSRAELAAPAERVAQWSEQAARRFALPATTIDAVLVGKALAGLAADADAIAGAGYRAAEQAWFAADTLYPPYARHARAEDPTATKKTLDRLFATLPEHPSLYEPAPFATQLRLVGRPLAESR